MTENGMKYRVGDVLMDVGNGLECVVTEVLRRGYMVRHLRDGGEMLLPEESLASYDRRRAFLTELKGLLERYDARIYPYGSEVDGLGICFGDNGDGLICYNMDEYSSMGELNADNIMDFERD